jgi:Arc/MetJ family transcription regulator
VGGRRRDAVGRGPTSGYPTECLWDILCRVKTTIDIDKNLAAEAAEILGTRTLKATVDAALREVVGEELRRRLAERVRSGTLPVPTPEEYRKLREPRLAPGALEGLRLSRGRERRRSA